MVTAFSRSLIASTSLKAYFPEKFCIFPSITTKPPSSFTVRRTVTVRCNSSGSEKGGTDDSQSALSGLVGLSIEELLNREENRDLLDGLEKAAQRVEIAKRELAEIERQEKEAKLLREYVNRLEARTSEIAECQKEISQAKAMLEEAERSLQIDGASTVTQEESEAIDQAKERTESVKAAVVSALVGTLAGLPISLTRATSYTELILPVGITFISCALFGVTFRYAVRRDLDNFQLKSGTSAAFAFVKGLGAVGGGLPPESNDNGLLLLAVDCAIAISENLLIFLFAGVVLDFCFKSRFLSPFPIRK